MSGNTDQGSTSCTTAALYYYIKAALPALLLALYSLFAKLGMSYNKRIMIIAKSRDYITEIPTKYLLLLATE